MHTQPLMTPSPSSFSCHVWLRSRFLISAVLMLIGATQVLAQSTFNVSDTSGNFNANTTWILVSGSGNYPGENDHIVVTSTSENKGTQVAFPNNGAAASLVYGTPESDTDITRDTIFRGSGDSLRTFTITGDLTKYDSGTLTFGHRGSGTGELALSVGGNVTLHEGTLNFGGSSNVRYLSGLTIGGTTKILGGTMNLHLSTNASLGTLILNNGTLSLNTGNVVNGENRTINVRSLNGTGGTIEEKSTGTPAAKFTLAITGETDDTATTIHTFAGTITNGTGTGSVAFQKSGVATQILSGANTYEGGTIVKQGTLIVSGSLASTGAISVAANAAFVAANALEVGNVSLTDGAILGFDLNQNASLKINGNFAATGAFVIDFLNTGEVGQIYSRLLSITGTGSDFGTVNFINFGAEGLAGQLTAAQLSGSFSIGNIPEPSHIAILLATICAIITSLIRRHHSRG